MEYRGHTIETTTVCDACGKVCAASYMIYLPGESVPIFAGNLIGSFHSDAAAALAALLKAQQWVDVHLAA